MVLLVLLCGCVGASRAVRRAADRGDLRAALSAYRELVDARGEGDPEVLAVIAWATLRTAASSDDPAWRSAGFAALRGLGERANSLFEALASRPGVVGDRATAALWELHGPSEQRRARLHLALTSSGQERRIAGMTLFSRGNARAALIRLSNDPDPRIRAEAIRLLARGRCSRRVRERLGEIVHTDASADVRAAAVRALGACGERAVSALERGLNDPELFVRMAVPSALLSASREHGRQLVTTLVGAHPDPLSVEAARALSQARDDDIDTWLLGVMRDGSQSLRVQAAVAAHTLAARHPNELARYLNDTNPEIVLRVAAALARVDGQRQRAREALRRLSHSLDGFVAVRALSALAMLGEGDLDEPVRGALRAPDSTVRRIAVLVWSDVRDVSRDSDELAPLLRDPDRSVALIAAVQIVLAAAR